MCEELDRQSFVVYELAAGVSASSSMHKQVVSFAVFWCGVSALQPARVQLPMRPSPEYSADEVCAAITGGLQTPNEPTLDAGYERLFHFMTYACRKAVTARQGAKSLANFTFGFAASSAALGSFVHLTRS